jgi:phage shock protein A
MDHLMKPTVHLNGTSKERLLEDLCDAIDALHKAGTALAKAAPNARDYYVQSNTAYATAAKQHDTRMQKLREVIDELETIATEFSLT